MTKKLNPNEAPPGYVAVASSLLCKGCAFDALDSCHAERAGHSCTKRDREDGNCVVFIKRTEAAKPTPLNSRYSQRMPAAVKAKPSASAPLL